jgi:L-fuconolactonase
VSASILHSPVRPDWLATTVEPALDPGRPIIDTHHHLYDRPGARYLLPDYLDDLATGHDVRASVFVQARAMLRADGPPELRPVGETEFVNGVAAMSASGLYGGTRVCAGIVGFADLTLGDAVRPILERHLMAAGGTARQGGRFCGVRQTLCWDEDSRLLNPAYPTTPDMAASPALRAGFAHLAALGLGFESWSFFHQLPATADLARAFPKVPIVVNHCGGIVRILDYDSRRPEVFDHWRRNVIDLARCPNVFMKLSGLGMRLGGFRFDERIRAPSSLELAEAWRPWIETGIEAFGPERCMVGSNFPVDKGSFGFAIGLNALKRLTQGTSESEKDAIFWRTGRDVYGLSLPGLPDR